MTCDCDRVPSKTMLGFTGPLPTLFIIKHCSSNAIKTVDFLVIYYLNTNISIKIQ